VTKNQAHQPYLLGTLWNVDRVDKKRLDADLRSGGLTTSEKVQALEKIVKGEKELIVRELSLEREIRTPTARSTVRKR